MPPSDYPRNWKQARVDPMVSMNQTMLVQLRGQLSDRTSTHTWAPSASEVRRQLAMCTLDVLPRLSITTGSLGSSC